MTARQGLTPLLALAAVLLIPAAFEASQVGDTPGQVAAACPYCRAPRGEDEFCAHCGRLARTTKAPESVRFWGDAFYVVPFPPVNAEPVITAELADQGLVRETAVFSSGDRFTLSMKKNDARVQGRLGTGGGSGESHMEAAIHDSYFEGRLTARVVEGSVSGKTKSYLYRKLEYGYGADGMLASIHFSTSTYARSSDWQKKPAAWLRHARGDILLIRDAGRLSRIQTTVSVGRRSLRGESEYADPAVTVEEVVRGADGSIERIVPSKEISR